MSIESLIQHYGLLAIFLGAGAEGETAVVAGGVIAHHGFVSPIGAGAAAAAGSFVADQIFFQTGRHFRDAAWVRRLREKPAGQKALALLEKYPRSFIFAYRFIYGIRTASPIAIGTSRVAMPLFVLVNAIAAVVWGALFTAIGYVFGDGVEQLVGRTLGHHWPVALAAVVVLGVGVALFLRRRSATGDRQPDQPDQRDHRPGALDHRG